MASLICWASGLLQIAKTSEVPVPGPVVLLEGTASKLTSLLAAHAEHRPDLANFYVPGTKPVPDDAEGNARQQQENMTLVIEFNKKLQRARAKQKGLKYLKEHDNANG